jgi:hypothetical protein
MSKIMEDTILANHSFLHNELKIMEFTTDAGSALGGTTDVLLS